MKRHPRSVSTPVSLRLALTAYYLQIARDICGNGLDVEEVEALSAYMKEVYVCPSLTLSGRRAN